MAPKRLRLLGVTVTPSYVLDDGDVLTPVSAGSLQILPGDWPRILEHFAAAEADLRAQLQAAEGADQPAESAEGAEGAEGAELGGGPHDGDG
jgi:hypothetical protein